MTNNTIKLIIATTVIVTATAVAGVIMVSVILRWLIGLILAGMGAMA